jgi:hypothetical protein
MILIMAILFAVTVLTTVVLLNTLHAPADVNTQIQSSGLEDIDRTEAQVADDMERLFLVHTSMARTGEALPYADATGGPDDQFGDVVSNYSDLNTALAASESGAAISVTYVEARSQEGMLVRQNGSQSFTPDGAESSDGNWTVLDNAERLPRFAMNVTDGPTASDRPFEVVVDGDTKLTFDEDGVEGARVDCDLAYPLQIDATNGVGTVSKNTEVCGTFDLDLPESGSFALTFENGSRIRGNYTVSGADTDTNIASEFIADPTAGRPLYNDVVVNPVFRVQYTDPTLTHESTFALYNETSP